MNTPNFLTKVSIMALIAGSSAFLESSPVVAQEKQAQEKQSSMMIEEIMVTARRKEERLQDVPVAVTAITGNKISENHITSFAEVQQLAPSLTLVPLNSSSMQFQIGMRGQRQTQSGVTVDPSVGIYFNDVYQGRAVSDTALFDLESVQVLRGPQGTLFGRNTTGGAVAVTTRRPDGKNSGYVKASLETPYAYNLEGAVNVPLGDKAGLRIAAVRNYRQGYTHVVNFPGYHMDDRDRYAARITLELKPNEKLRSTFIGDYFESNENGTALYPLVYNPNFSIPPLQGLIDALRTQYDAQSSLGWHDVTLTNDQTKSHNKIYGIQNVTEYEFSDNLKVKNIIAYRKVEARVYADLDAVELGYLYVDVNAPTKQWSEELQLQGLSFNNRLDWIIGGYFFQEKGTDESRSWAFRPAFSVDQTNNRFTGKNTARSVFAHASYELSTSLPSHIFGGVRYSSDKREVIFRSGRVAGGAFQCLVENAPATLGVPGGECAVPADKTYNSTTWNVGVDIKPVEDLMFYGAVSRGFRSGGYNGRAQSAFQQNPFRPEWVTNYEVGMKAQTFLDGVQFALDVAMYYSKYSDIQSNIIVLNNGAPVSTAINAGKATIKGIEIETTIVPTDWLRLGGYFSYTDPYYTEFTQLGVDVSNNEFSLVPKTKAGASATARIFNDSEVGSVDWKVNWRYNGGFELAVFNEPGDRVKAYNVVDTTVTWENAMASSASVDFYVKNVFNRKYNLGGFDVYGSLGYAGANRGDPRVFGIEVKVPFGG